MNTTTTHCEAAAKSASERGGGHEAAGRQRRERDRDALEEPHPMVDPDDAEEHEHAREHAP